MASPQQKRFRAFILITGSVVTLIFLFWPLWARRVLKPGHLRDYEEAPPQQGVGTVVVCVPPRPEQFTGRGFPARVLVRVQGQVREAKTIVGFDGLKENGSAQVTYRVGKSGHVYVDRVEPLPTPH